MNPTHNPSAIPPASFDPPASIPGRAWWTIALLLAAYVLLRCLYAPLMELSGDEAYYWTWSRCLAGGYLDHAPMVAWVIRLGTMLIGNSELGVRFPAALLSAGTIAAGIWLASQITPILPANNATALAAKPSRLHPAVVLTLLLLAFPLLHVLGAIITPDTPAVFFTTLAIGMALRCITRPAGLGSYVVLGIFCGLAMLSKYTSLVSVVSILAVLLLHDRRRFGRIILAGLVACIVLWPMLRWNYQHDWVSFRFQLRHGTNIDAHATATLLGMITTAAGNLATFIGSQLLVGSPILAPLMIFNAYRALRSGHAPRRLLAIAGLVPLTLFACTSFLHKVEANWTSQAYLPLLILLFMDLPTYGQRFGKLYLAGIRVAAVSVLVLHIPPAILARLAPGTSLARIGGFRTLAAQTHTLAGNLPVVSTRYQDAGLLAFYLPGQPRVTILREPGDRVNQDTIAPTPLPPGEFLLITDGGPTIGTTVPFFHGQESFPVDILSRQEISAVPDNPRLHRNAIRAQRAP